MEKDLKNIKELGGKKDKRDRRDYRLAGVQQPVPVPASFRLADKFPVKAQGQRPSCTSQASSMHKQFQEDMELSAEFIMIKTKQREGNTSSGAYTRNAMLTLVDFGTCSNQLMPEPDDSVSWVQYISPTRLQQKQINDATTHKSESAWRVDCTVDGLKQAVYQNKLPVVMSMAWYSEYNRPDRYGLLPIGYNFVDGHVVAVTGWNDQQQIFWVKNSFGPNWGNAGYFKLPYGFVTPKIVWDAWMSRDLPQNLPVDTRYGMERTWVKYLEEKKMAFNSWLFGKIGRLPNNREINGLVYGVWSYEAVFRGKVGDIWLKITKSDAIKGKLIDSNENLLK